MVSSDEYGRVGNMAHGKMDQRLTTLEETLDSVSESVIDKLIPAVIKMQKDVKVSLSLISHILQTKLDYKKIPPPVSKIIILFCPNRLSVKILTQQQSSMETTI